MDRYSAIKKTNEYLGEEVCNDYNAHSVAPLVDGTGWRIEVPVEKFARTDLYLLPRYSDGRIICIKIPARRFGDPKSVFRRYAPNSVKLLIGESGEDFLKVKNTKPVRDFNPFVIAEFGPLA